MKNKKIYTGVLIVLFCAVLSFMLFFTPITRGTKKYEDISINHYDNGYRIIHEVKIKPSNEIVKIKSNDIEIQYVNGYVSKNGRKAHLEEYTIKTIVGYRKSYKLIITESIG